MAEAEQADGGAGDLAMDSLGSARPIRPLALAQVGIGAGERDVAGEQGAHHVFGDGLLMAEAIPDACWGQRREIDRVIAGAGQWEASAPQAPAGCVELGGDNHIGQGIGWRSHRRECSAAR